MKNTLPLRKTTYGFSVVQIRFIRCHQCDIAVYAGLHLTCICIQATGISRRFRIFNLKPMIDDGVSFTATPFLGGFLYEVF